MRRVFKTQIMMKIKINMIIKNNKNNVNYNTKMKQINFIIIAIKLTQKMI